MYVGCESQRLPVATAVNIFLQCAAGMRQLHSLNIVHRDFRAANILIQSLDEPLHVVVADFGVSHQTRAYSPEAVAVAQSGYYGASGPAVVHDKAGLFPVAFAAPEVLAGDFGKAVVATRGSDVYMFGGFMFEVRRDSPSR